MTLLLLSVSPGFWRRVVAGLQRSFWREHPQKTPWFRWKNLQVRQSSSELQRASENALDDETLSPLISMLSTAIAHQLCLPGSLCSSWCTLPSADGSDRNVESRHLKGSLHVVFVTWVAVLHHQDDCSLWLGWSYQWIFTARRICSHNIWISCFFSTNFLEVKNHSLFWFFFLCWIILLTM